jgi:hypothetical protein
MTRFLKVADSVCRWLFVLVTWLVCVALIYDYWQTFEGLINTLTSSVPLPGLILGGVIMIGMLYVLVRYGMVLRFVVIMLFFLSIAILYSYVGSRLSTTLSNALDGPNKKSTRTLKTINS